MECFSSLVVIVVIVVFAAALRSGRAPTTLRASSGSAYQRVAQHFRGTLVKRGIWRRPLVSFAYGSAQAVLRPGKRRVQGRRRAVTVVEVDLPESDLRLAAAPASFPQPPQCGRLTVFTRGDADFDQRFRLAANRPDPARQFLGEGVVWQLEALARLEGRAPFWLTLRDGRLRVEKFAALRSYEALESLVNVVLALHDQAQLSQSEGIEFLDAADAHVLDQVKCQVCGEEIEMDMVFCRKCRTPHHHDCWQYYGSCSTYGCHETRYAQPGIAQPIREPDEPSG